MHFVGRAAAAAAQRLVHSTRNEAPSPAVLPAAYLRVPNKQSGGRVAALLLPKGWCAPPKIQVPKRRGDSTTDVVLLLPGKVLQQLPCCRHHPKMPEAMGTARAPLRPARWERWQHAGAFAPAAASHPMAHAARSTPRYRTTPRCRQAP